MTYKNITIEKDEAVCLIQINRPQARNAVDGETAAELAEAFRQFEADANLHVAILGGLGDNFCAGADLKSMSNEVKEEGDGPMGPTRMLLSKPVIAAVSGYAVAGGLELAVWCDLRVVEETAVFGVFCRRWGVPLIDGGTIRLPRLIGHSRAMDLILTGRPVEANEALAIGLANRVVAKGKAMDEALALAKQIAAFPQICMREDRLSAYEQWGMSLDGALNNEYKHGLDVIKSGEPISGAKTFSDGEGRHGRF
ncbi:unnamed protein product [Cyprideis torosa]|uniref:Uncharacterized protein n=1 Tax=Cyprideis torosa TaxID=163714 RepID=A0A7R8X139_9CRUS|nr:unnamed protein product [Cyprideis torosa]CAG0910164.1 unnamed protein product [Cyprideis torosa]